MSDPRDAFDAALIAGMRDRLAEGYARFRAVEARGIPATAPSWAGGTVGQYRDRNCPACGTPPTDISSLTAHGIDLIECHQCTLTYTRQVLDKAADAARYQNSAIDAEAMRLRCSAPYLELETARADYYLDRIGETCNPPGALLEIGCGTGTFLTQARLRGWEVTGVEPGAAAAQVARGKDIDVIDGYFPDDLAPDTVYDLIAVLDVLEHFGEPIDFLRKIASRLRPNGRLFVQVPNWDSLLIRLEGASSSVVCPGHWSYFNPRTLRDVLGRSGYETVWTETVVSELDRIARFSPEQQSDVIAELRPSEKLSSERLTAGLIHKLGLSYKLIGLFVSPFGSELHT